MELPRGRKTFKVQSQLAIFQYPWKPYGGKGRGRGDWNQGDQLGLTATQQPGQE